MRRTLSPALRRVIGIIITLLVIPVGIMAQDVGESDQAYKFSKEELTQMLAPIALYPDALAAQILMASTYPLEVVEADRWRSRNLQLRGTDLDNALLNEDWDPSIKSLCHFPDILKSLSDKLDQTRKLGDAFLGQEDEVMATMQELRGKARAEGHLLSTNQQKVIEDEGNIRIEPANPEVIYVPVYDPAYVYGPWWYPAYPPYYWYYPAGFYGGAYISFGPGFYFGFNDFAWAWFDWPIHQVHIDNDRARRFHRFHRERDDDHDGGWRHNPEHRRGVAYRDLRTSQRFGGRAPRGSFPANLERRGYPQGRNEQPEGRTSRKPVLRGEPQTPQVRQERAQTPEQIHQTPAARPPSVEPRHEGAAPTWKPSLPERGKDTVRPDSPFFGVGEGSFERRAEERGNSSSRSYEMRQGSGGFMGGQRPERQGDEGSRGGERGGNSRRDR